MEEKLTKEEVLHVADLARIGLTDDEIKRYQVDLKKLLTEVEKINEVKGYDEEIMFTPVMEQARIRKDREGEMLSANVALSNAPVKNGNFVEVPVMIHE